MSTGGRCCPYCEAKTSRVLDKRSFGDKRTNWRRIACFSCGCRWSTRERWDGVRDPHKKVPEKGSKERYFR